MTGVTLVCDRCGGSEPMPATYGARVYVAKMGGAPCPCGGLRVPKLDQPAQTGRVVQTGPAVRNGS